MSHNQEMLDSQDIEMNQDLDMQNRINNFNHVESTVIKRD